MPLLRCIRPPAIARPPAVKAIAQRSVLVARDHCPLRIAFHGKRLASTSSPRWIHSPDDSSIPQHGPTTAVEWNDAKEDANRTTISQSQNEPTSILSEIGLASITSDSQPHPAERAPQEDPLQFLSTDDFLPGQDHRAGAALLRRALELQDNEKEFIHKLQQTINLINKIRHNPIDVLFTGGFVRDKLLGRQISNMDIVLLNISPAEFVQTLIDHHQWENHVKERLWPEYLFAERDAREKDRGQDKANRRTFVGKKERKGDGKMEVPKRHRVRTHNFSYTNPAGNAIQVVGLTHFSHELNCEFVSFPRQVHTEEEGKVALVEDAMQRELTVNAIYLRAVDYAILDPTGLGLKDIHDRILRTPKTPRDTLLADPIRVLRTMKFVGRLYDDGFKPDPSLTQAMLTSQVKNAFLTSYTPERLQREIANTLHPKNNPYRVLQMIRGTGYYRDLFHPPSPTATSPVRSREFPNYRTTHRDFFAAAFFINLLSSKWEMWAPFAEALYNLPSRGYVQSDCDKVKVMMVVRENILSFAYALAVVVPYQHLPQPASVLANIPKDEPKTVPGQIVQALSNRLVRPWQLIDQMFLTPQKTLDSIDRVLQIQNTEQWRAFLNDYGPYWAATVLCACVIRWTDLAREAKWAAEYHLLWKKSERSWMEVVKAVDNVRWMRRRLDGEEDEDEERFVV